MNQHVLKSQDASADLLAPPAAKRIKGEEGSGGGSGAPTAGEDVKPDGRGDAGAPPDGRGGAEAPYDDAYLAARREELATQGYTTFEGLMTTEEREVFIELFNDWLVSRRMPNGAPTGADMTNPASFAQRAQALPVTNIHGIEKYQVGQAQMMWFVRMLPRVLQVFAFLHGCSVHELVASLDGACILTSNCRNAPPRTATAIVGDDVFGWLHLDQGNGFTANPGPTCFQAFYNHDDTSFATPAERRTGTFACIPRAHLVHNDFVRAHGVRRANWHVLTAAQYQWYAARGFAAQPVSIPANALFVWDSRLPHQNMPKHVPTDDPADITFRRVAYVSMLPHTTRTARDIERAPAIFQNERATTSHWAGHGGLQTNKPPRIYSPVQRQLVPAADTATLVGYGDLARVAREHPAFACLYNSLTLRRAVPESLRALQPSSAQIVAALRQLRVLKSAHTPEPPASPT